jgi:arginyl-tRNA synthetase
MSLRAALIGAIADARDRAIAAGAVTPAADAALPEIGIEQPANPDHGDWASNAAMQLAPVLRAPPMRIAEAIRDHFDPPPAVAELSVAAPGFLNFRLDPRWLGAQVAAIRAAGPAYGHGATAAARRINVEFVSANPTGPLHVGNARGAFVGDVLSRVLEAAGHEVTREYYFNDFGGQVKALGASVRALRANEPIPEDGYRGDYVREMADSVPVEVVAAADAAAGDEVDWVYGRWASEVQRRGIEASLAALGVKFDVWKTESSVHEDGWVERGVEQLRQAGYVHEADGATWFRATAFGEDQDRVIHRSNGQPTYFAADIGYVSEKFSRGFDELIYIWGENHHGAIARLLHAAEALGHDPEAVRILLYSWVRFVRDGEAVSMSKRAGEFIELDDLVREVGVDPVRWFFSSRAFTSGIDFDLELAKKQSSENPVYYVQYAHARASSILRAAATEGLSTDDARTGDLLDHPAEQALLRALLDFPDTVGVAADRRETHEVPRYAYELASAFSQFYRDCKVLTDDPALTAARLALVDATRSVLANALGLLGISAPDTM